MLLGGRLLARPASLPFGGPLGAYTASALLGVVAIGCAAGAKESLPKSARVSFTLQGSNPLGFLRLFRAGDRTNQGGAPTAGGNRDDSTAERIEDAGGGRRRLVGTLALILALQTLHDGEGDVWQVYGADVHGWGTHSIS